MAPSIMNKMKSRLYIGLVVALCQVPAPSQPAGPHRGTASVIPVPASIEYSTGFFLISPSTRVVAVSEAAAEAAKLIDALAPATGFRLRRITASQQQERTINLELDPNLSQLGEEGYAITVTSERILIRAKRPAGLFYAIQTLLQLLPPPVFSRTKVEGVPWKVPCVKITDYPRFRWRGLLVDPARHFISMQDLKQFIDVMAIHKFNRLQVHLTDNEGWRIEIKKYPKLTELGSKMDWNLRHKGGTGPRCFGFYKQDDIREMVSYAADHHITIVPEIEMPYHTGAAIVAYPELGINTGHLAELAPEQRWGKTKGLITPRPETVAFLQDVLGEVIELFAGRYIHIGGDEANTVHWARDPEMQAQMKRLKLKDVHELHSWFIKQMDTFLAGRGRRLVGWDEILQGGLAPGATVMSWRGEKGGITAANAGHDVVMAPTSHTYFDYYQGPREKEPLAIGGYLPLEKVYGYDPIPEAIPAEKAKHILGVQGQLWGEYISNPAHREYMAYPRAVALAEVAWSQEALKKHEDFLARLPLHLQRLKAMAINYRPLDAPTGDTH